MPVVHENGTYALPIRKLRIDWSRPWLQRMERAIISAYESSAWFEYYHDELFSIMDSRHEYLFDLDLDLIRFFLAKTGIAADIRFTEEYTAYGSDIYGRDMRGVFHPKRANSVLDGLQLKKPYWQVFSLKHGFIPDLSIMDLLFNEGPDSISYLKRI